MDMEILLTRLKLSLPLTSDTYDELLEGFLRTAIDKFEADTQSESDQTLVILYAGWLWRSQKDSGLQKPPALQMAINDRAVRKATEDGNV